MWLTDALTVVKGLAAKGTNLIIPLAGMLAFLSVLGSTLMAVTPEEIWDMFSDWIEIMPFFRCFFLAMVVFCSFGEFLVNNFYSVFKFSEKSNEVCSTFVSFLYVISISLPEFPF